ncbi:MAG: L,D-transpeptidase [Olsenella sp.]|nr:L,D-transpeptidase [Olsenella sp.]
MVPDGATGLGNSGEGMEDATMPMDNVPLLDFISVGTHWEESMAAANHMKGSGQPEGHGASHRPRAALLVMPVLVALLAAAYVAGAVFFSSHFMPGTTFAGTSLAWEPHESLAAACQEACDSYCETFTKGDFSIAITGPDIGLAPNPSSLAADLEALSGNPWAWPAEVLSTRSVASPRKLSYDEEKLAGYVGAQVEAWNKTASPSGAPSVAYVEERESFEVVPGAEGAQMDASAVAAALAQAASALGPGSELGDDVLVAPAADEDTSSLEAVADEGNAMLDLSIPILVNGEEGYRIERGDIRSWLGIADGQITIDEGKIATWVDDVLSPAINYSDSRYEWHTWRDDNTELIVAALRSLSEEPIEAKMFPLLRVPDETPGARDRGRHIDVCLATQYARMYDESGNIIWESFVVTGTPDAVRYTPTGTFAIQAKERNVTLVGADQDGDGEPDYRTPVDYWMPFYAGNGLHDATWRSSFGGDIYIYDGSHGCVNLPYAKAAELFELVRVGDTVYVH